MPTTYASDSTSSADVQAKIDVAITGDTVIIRNGSATWSTPVTISGKAITLKGQSHGGVTITSDVSGTSTLAISKTAAGVIDVSDVIFDSVASGGSPSSTFHISASGAGRPVLVHGCTFNSNNAYLLYSILWESNGGVIYDNTFTATGGKTINGISLVGTDDSTWLNASTMGTADTDGEHNTYIEHNTFNFGWNASINPDDDCRVVIRNNTFYMTTISPHAADTSKWGVRHMEVYDNEFQYYGPDDPTTALNYWLYIRGGTGVIYRNIMPDVPWGKPEVAFICQNINRGQNTTLDGVTCPTTYPVRRQVGQSANGSGYITEPYYVWGNTGDGLGNTPGIAEYLPDDCGNGLLSSNFIQSGRDYIADGSAKPGWTAYTYPHPLTGLTAATQSPAKLIPMRMIL